MIDYSIKNKKAWEYNAYDFWVKQSGTQVDRAKRDLELKQQTYAVETAAAAEADLNFEQPTMSCFSKEIFEGEMAHARFFEENVREQMPECSYRKYTISEIINSVINSGFTLSRFDEHPAWTNEKIPGEFTITEMK